MNPFLLRISSGRVVQRSGMKASGWTKALEAACGVVLVMK